MTPDNPLYFVTKIPPTVRLWIYIVASFIAFGLSIWQATDHNPLAFLTLLALSMVHSMSSINTPQPPKDGQQ